MRTLKPNAAKALELFAQGSYVTLEAIQLALRPLVGLAVGSSAGVTVGFGRHLAPMASAHPGYVAGSTLALAICDAGMAYCAARIFGMPQSCRRLAQYKQNKLGGNLYDFINVTGAAAGYVVGLTTMAPLPWHQ